MLHACIIIIIIMSFKEDWNFKKTKIDSALYAKG